MKRPAMATHGLRGDTRTAKVVKTNPVRRYLRTKAMKEAKGCSDSAGTSITWGVDLKAAYRRAEQPKN